MDPRDEQWGDDAPAYRVYFWSQEGASDEYRLSDLDVPEVLSWAERKARASGRTYSLMAEVHTHDELGLIRLAGWDPNVGPVAEAGQRPQQAQARPSGRAGLLPLPGGAFTNGAHILDDRVLVTVVVHGDVDLAASFAWEVTDDVGTQYSFAGGGTGGGSDGVAYGGVGFRPRPPAEATRLYIARGDDPSRTELPLF